MEELEEVALSPGLTGGPQMIGDAVPPFQWSNGALFLATATKVGDFATFTLGEQYHPRRIIIHPTVSHDYGTLDFRVNDVLVKRGWDGYNAAPQPGKPIDLGVCRAGWECDPHQSRSLRQEPAIARLLLRAGCAGTQESGRY